MLVDYRFDSPQRGGNGRRGLPVARSGMAMLLVVTLLAVVSVMALAMLGSSVLRAQASGNSAESAQAMALAESGVNLAVYYLRHADQAPVLHGAGHWPGADGIDLGLGGTTDVSVTRLSDNFYEIVATGHAPGGMQRGLWVRARVNMAFRPLHAAGFRSGSLRVERNTEITGNVQADGMLWVGGRIFSTAVSPLGILLLPLGYVYDPVIAITPPPAVVPTADQIKDYRTYTYQGQTYQAVQVPNNMSTKYLGPTAENPAGIYWANSSLRLPGDTVVEGTLLVPNGNLIVPNGFNSISPAPGFPAAIVKGDLVMENAAKTLEIDGLVWLGGNITRPGTGGTCILTIRGSLLMASGSGTMAPNQNGRINIFYDAEKAHVAELTSAVAQGPYTVTILDWQTH